MCGSLGKGKNCIKVSCKIEFVATIFPLYIGIERGKLSIPMHLIHQYLTEGFLKQYKDYPVINILMLE